MTSSDLSWLYKVIRWRVILFYINSTIRRNDKRICHSTSSGVLEDMRPRIRLSDFSYQNRNSPTFRTVTFYISHRSPFPYLRIARLFVRIPSKLCFFIYVYLTLTIKYLYVLYNDVFSFGVLGLSEAILILQSIILIFNQGEIL